MGKKVKTYKISKEQLLKMQKKVNREIALESNHPRGGYHQTSKKDIENKRSNTVRNWEED